jgi:hypothetical protein
MPRTSDANPDTWRQAILADETAAQQELVALESRDHRACMQVCLALLTGPALEVKRAALLLLKQRGDPSDARIEAGVLTLLDQPMLKDDALAALARVATRAALPVLFAHAERGSAPALAALHTLAHSDDERAHLLRVARQQLFSQNSATREQSLAILRALSSLAAEEELLLRATRRYYDVFIIQAVGETSGSVLPALQQLLPRFSITSAEHHALSLAIRRLRLTLQRKR